FWMANEWESTMVRLSNHGTSMTLIGIITPGDQDARFASSGPMSANYGATVQTNGMRQGANAAFDDAQNQLYQNVLDRLTSRMIDISSIDKPYEQADLTDREQAIYDKLSTVRKSVELPSNHRPVVRSKTVVVVLELSSNLMPLFRLRLPAPIAR